MKEIKHAEKIVKGFANHYRIAILQLLEKKPELSVGEIADELGANMKTISEHTRRLSSAGLVMKRYEEHNVRHKVSDRGKQVLKFLRILE